VSERKPFIGSKTVWFISELIEAKMELAAWLRGILPMSTVYGSVRGIASRRRRKAGL